MPALDFKEIPEANVGGGLQDTFELLARDFFSMFGFKIETGPDRGPDRGRDLLISELREGPLGATPVRWLVSCKHFAHSGEAVGMNDEPNISDRVRGQGASGFLGFYSTLPTSQFTGHLDGLRTNQGLECQIFDRERIERELLTRDNGTAIAKRYFPKSFTAWKSEHPGPVNLFTEYEPLQCHHCGKDLLSDASGIVVFVSRPPFPPNHIVDVYWSCKGDCDRVLEELYKKRSCITGWEDVKDLLIPYMYISFVMAAFNRIRDGEDVYEDKAFERFKDFILEISQLVLRHQKPQQIKRAKLLRSLPPC